MLLKFAQLLVEIVQSLARCLVGFFLERFTLDLELNNSPLELVHRFGFRIYFYADACRGFVHEIDRLVRQLTIADVAV